MTAKIRWGIMSTGYIARQFATCLKTLEDAEIAAVGSRSRQTAEEFGSLFEIPRRHASYEALANDPDVDAIYIGTPHSLHHENTLLCLHAGKHVLCEKPFAINTRQAREMVETARQKNLFLMDAVWTRFFPVMYKLRELLQNEAIGIPRILTADFGFAAKYEPCSRLFSPEFGGGSLLDIGIYPVMLASMIFGKSESISGLASVGGTGVDEQNAMTFRYPNGALALLYSTFQTITPNEAVLTGTLGRIKIHSPWWKPAKLSLALFSQPEEMFDLSYSSEGYQYEAMEVMHCIRAGRTESEIMPLDETLSILQIMDDLRAQWGVKYPMD